MQKINDYNFSGRKALIRVDFNVPLDGDFNITDDTRIRAAIPTIKKVLSDGGSVVLMSHLGRPKSGPENKFSLNHILKRVAELTSANVSFANDCISSEAIELSEGLPPEESSEEGPPEEPKEEGSLEGAPLEE